MFEKAEILERRAQDDRHFIERHTALRFVEDATDDLDRLAPFPRRREQRDVAGAFAPRRSVDRKHVAAKVRQVAGRRRPVGLRLDGSAQRN